MATTAPAVALSRLAGTDVDGGGVDVDDDDDDASIKDVPGDNVSPGEVRALVDRQDRV